MKATRVELAWSAATMGRVAVEENTSSARDRGFCLRREARPKSPDGLSPPVETETDRWASSVRERDQWLVPWRERKNSRLGDDVVAEHKTLFYDDQWQIYCSVR